MQYVGHRKLPHACRDAGEIVYMGDVVDFGAIGCRCHATLLSFALGKLFRRGLLGGHFGVKLEEFFQAIGVAPFNV